jgi:hypothetical protein
MAMQTPAHPGSGADMPVALPAPIDQSVRTVILTLGVIAAWIGMMFGFAQLTERAFGYTERDAWVLAFAVVTYIAAFIGVIVGIVALVRRADDDFLARSE